MLGSPGIPRRSHGRCRPILPEYSAFSTTFGESCPRCLWGFLMARPPTDHAARLPAWQRAKKVRTADSDLESRAAFRSLQRSETTVRCDRTPVCGNLNSLSLSSATARILIRLMLTEDVERMQGRPMSSKPSDALATLFNCGCKIWTEQATSAATDSISFSEETNH